MNVHQRIDLLAELGAYCASADPAWLTAQRRAHAANGWFTPEFISLAIRGIATQFLEKEKLRTWARKYDLTDKPDRPRTVGLTMAGNIPLVGFHDFLSIFLSGHRQLIRPSSKDDILIRQLIQHLVTLEPAAAECVGFAERLNGCDAYIATGSNNSARYFEYYFSKYPHIIRRNRTSVAWLTGEETMQELECLADDVYQYFGLGCRNVTQLYVPENYDFLSLLQAFRKYNYLAQWSKYKHNYDYQMTLLILNKKVYMSNESILLTENPSPFSPISVLHYSYYRPGDSLPAGLSGSPDIQCMVGRDPRFAESARLPAAAGAHGTRKSLQSPGSPATPANPETAIPPVIPFGHAQQPGLEDYADGVDTLQFLKSIG